MKNKTKLPKTSNWVNMKYIGVLVGVWPESESFSDKGYSPVASLWKGRCVEVELPQLQRTLQHKKIIGARWYVKAFLAQTGRTNLRDSENNFDYMSACDSNGHGTHTASTAAGSPVEAASFNGLASPSTKWAGSRGCARQPSMRRPAL